ncbi:MAG TPA: spore protease YyaC [Firmicutes bacterium]|nr:spore protease YyaC [Bacillota bacterium]
MDDALAVHKLAVALGRQLRFLADGRRPLAAVCIGTDRSTGDALGPLTGSRLTELACPGLIVLGTLAEPVHATNLAEALGRLNQYAAAPLVIAVDACLGRLESVGSITLARGALRPGAGVNKNLPAVGDLHITGIVNVGGFMEYMVLQNTRLHLVYRMAQTIASSIAIACRAVGTHQAAAGEEEV